MPAFAALVTIVALMPIVGPSPTLWSRPMPPQGITTLSAVQESELFSSLELTLDSAQSTVNERRYRPASRAMRPYISLDLTVLGDRSVGQVRLGIPPAMMRSMALFLREPYADFVEAVVPAFDQDALQPFLAQVRGDLAGIADGDFVARDADVAGMPQRPTAMYAAFLNTTARARLALGTTTLHIDNIGNGRDSATVLTLAATSDAPTQLAAADWIVPSWDLLGAPIARAGEHPLIASLDLHASGRDGSTVTYRSENEDAPIELALEVGAGGAIQGISMRFPNPALLGLDDMALPTLLTTMIALVPHGDSTAVVAAAREVAFAEDSSDLSPELQALAALIAGTRDVAELPLPSSIVALRRDGEEMLVAHVRSRRR